MAYEVLPGNTSDKTTLRDFLKKIETRYGKAKRTWVMDRGIPTEDVLAQMRAAEGPVSYLVGTPRGRLTQLEKTFLGKPWESVAHVHESAQRFHESAQPWNCPAGAALEVAAHTAPRGGVCGRRLTLVAF